MYESNGPDVKIRGTASHVAEKYLQLARDAQSSGDPVAAENYYQHAEHYFRLIAAAQEQFRQSQPYYQPGGDQRGNLADDGYDEGDGEQPSISGEPFAPREPQPFYPRDQQQPQAQPHHNQQRTQHRRPMRKTSNGCHHSSPAANRRRSRNRRKAVHIIRTARMARTDRMDMTARPTAFRCIGDAAVIAARAIMLGRVVKAMRRHRPVGSARTIDQLSV